jgi:hypothetical protein
MIARMASIGLAPGRSVSIASSLYRKGTAEAFHGPRCHSTTESNSHLFNDWLDPIETGIRDRVRELIEEMIRSELDAVLSRPRYGRRAGPAENSDVTDAFLGRPVFVVCKPKRIANRYEGYAFI